MKAIIKIKGIEVKFEVLDIASIDSVAMSSLELTKVHQKIHYEFMNKAKQISIACYKEAKKND